MKRNLIFTILAGILAPCAAVIIASGLALLVHPEPGKPVALAMLSGLMALVYIVPAVLLYGLPLFLLFRKFKLANLFTSVLSSLAPIAFAALSPPVAASIEQLLVFALFFLVSAFGFWFFARKTLSVETTS